MRDLLRFLKPYLKESVLAPLFKLLEATLELFVPLVVTVIIDKGIADKDQSLILWMGALLLGLATVGMSVSITAQFFAAKAAVGFTTDLKHDLFRHITRLDARAVDNISPATLMTRMTSDVNQVQSALNLFLRLFSRSPFILVGSTVMAFTINAVAALVFVGVIVFLSLSVYLSFHFTLPGYRHIQSLVDRVLLKTRENLAGVRVIRAFLRQDVERESFKSENDALYEKQIKIGRIAAWMNPVTLVIVNAGIILLIYVGGINVEVGNLTQGQVVALVNYMSQVLIELLKLAMLIISMNKAMACAGRIRDLYALEEVESATGNTESESGTSTAGSDVADGEYAAEATESERVTEGELDSICCAGMSFSYPDSQGAALGDISFDVKKGETLGIIGGTGAGKSTLLSILLRFYDATSGSLSIFGKSIKSIDRKTLRSMIGYVPQKSVLFSGTVRENLCLGGLQRSDEELWKALEIAKADEFIKKKSKGLDAKVEAHGRNFSGGQRQRLCIARAIVRKPEILIMDDAFSALDTATELSLREGLREYFSDKNTVMFIVSQRIASVKAAEHILVLDDGAVCGYGTHDELLETSEVYREINRIGGES